MTENTTKDQNEQLFDQARQQATNGEYAQATKLYRQILLATPHDYKALNNLGLALLELDQPQDARASLQTAVDLQPDNEQLLFNYATALHRCMDLNSAVKVWSSLAKQQPDEAEIHFNLGVSLQELEQYIEAADAYAKAIEIDPRFYEAWSNQATVLFEAGDILRSCTVRIQATQLQEHATDFFELGKIAEFGGDDENALKHYLKVISLDPAHPTPYSLAADTYARLGQNQAAIALLERFPEPSVIIDRQITMLQEAEPSAPPQDYIEALFDDIAPSFDKSLKLVNYRGPQLLEQALARQLSADTSERKVLDIGCGTGLSGIPLRNISHRLEGVDLSAAMLQKAKERDLYDTLTHSEILAHLDGKHAVWDVISGSDVLNYFGELRPLFTAVHQALAGEKLLAFCVESGPNDEDYSVQANGRFHHSRQYLEAALEDSGFTLLSIEGSDYRKERRDLVQGWFVCARAR